MKRRGSKKNYLSVLKFSAIGALQSSVPVVIAVLQLAVMYYIQERIDKTMSAGTAVVLLAVSLSLFSAVGALYNRRHKKKTEQKSKPRRP